MRSAPVAHLHRRHATHHEYVIGDPALWQPLLDELAAEIDKLALGIEEERQRREQAVRALPQIARSMGPLPGLPKLPELEFRADGDRVQEYVCEVCGVRYIGGVKLRANEARVCSNRCWHARSDAMKRQYRRDHPLDYDRNGARAERRAAARAGRTCGHCGMPIEAARATKRYCSDICRVRAYRAVKPRIILRRPQA